MKIYANKKSGILWLKLVGELDECSAKRARREADGYAESFVGGEKAVLDLSEVSFMDSTGIGFLIGRYKKFNRLGIPLYISSPSANTDRILMMSGVYTLLPKL